MSASRFSLAERAIDLLMRGEDVRGEAMLRRDPALSAVFREIEAALAGSPVQLPAEVGSSDLLFSRIMRDLSAGGAEGQWESEHSGVAFRTLWNADTLLFRCVAGTPLPGHYHDREERMVILDGDLRIGASLFTTGMCELSPRFTHHDDGVAREDCLVLIQYGAL
jgi:hypothetical protein